jgi:mannose-1-phosphate guanylyltransferase
MPKDSEFEHAYAVIMAGGSGTRFWPLSRRKHPKQLLELFGRGTLLEQAASRVRAIISPERTYVFTSEILRRAVSRRLPEIPRDQIVAEPVGRNTAPTVGLAAHEIVRRDREALMVVLPSDHVILKPAAFRRALRTACKVASSESCSVVLGLRPSRPDTGFGYVRLGSRMAGWGNQDVYRVEEFTEKPPLALARRYLVSGRYLWNGGMFIWRASTLIENLERHQPRMARALARLAAAGGARSRGAMRNLFPRLEKISIDYALMEKTSGVVAVAADIGWSDVGSWATVYELGQKDKDHNVKRGNVVCLDSERNMIVSDKKVVVTVGIRDLVVVETDDALLVAARDRSQDVGKTVRELERRGRQDLL